MTEDVRTVNLRKPAVNVNPFPKVLAIIVTIALRKNHAVDVWKGHLKGKPFLLDLTNYNDTQQMSMLL